MHRPNWKADDDDDGGQVIIVKIFIEKIYKTLIINWRKFAFWEANFSRLHKRLFFILNFVKITVPNKYFNCTNIFPTYPKLLLKSYY